MVTPDLERFRLKVREYRLLVNRNQGDLAAYLNLDYNELSNRLNAHKNVRLSHDNVRGIVRTLADWGAITTQAQAKELLDMMLCPHFDPADWQARPLSKLIATLTPSTSAVSAYSKKINRSGKPLLTSQEVNQQSDNGQYASKSQEPSNNLPQRLSNFIGRHKELAELKMFLTQEKVRLLTLVGAGGTGKTRLALQIGAALVDYFTGGVWLVELAPFNQPALIPAAIAKTLGIVEQPGQPLIDTLVQYLHKRQMLLILDNCEHLIEECSLVVERLLEYSTHLQILSTSREGLGISGEVSFPVPSLSVPRPDENISIENLDEYEALQLFTMRARTASPDFRLDAKDIQALVQVCRRLDGIPLALELAAARIRVLTLEQIQFRLDNRFHLLSGGSRTALPRQQTLKALVDWSFDLLPEKEQKLLVWLSVFAGSWDLSTGGWVCIGAGWEEYELLDGLGSLVNKSLVVVGKLNGEVRYSLLETIRQYGVEKLKVRGEEEEARKRHLAYYATVSREWRQKLRGKEQLATLKYIDKELDNVRAAIDYALQLRQCEPVLDLIVNLYWDLRGYYQEAQGYLNQVLAVPGIKVVSRGMALFYAGFLAMRQGNIQAGRTYFEECLRLSSEYNDKELLAYIFTGMGELFLQQGNNAEARRYFEECLSVTEELGQFYKAAARGNLGAVLMEQGEYDEARRLFKESVAIGREIGDKWMLTLVLLSQASLALVLKDYLATNFYLDETLTISEEMDFQLGKGRALAYRGIVLSNENKFKEAGLALEESLALTLKGRERLELFVPLAGVVELLSQVWLKRNQSDPDLVEKVACLGGAIAALVASSEAVLRLPVRPYYDEALEFARAGLSEAAYEKAFTSGQVMSLEEVIAYSRKALSGI